MNRDQKRSIEGRMKHFFNQQQALLKLPIKDGWKQWLSSPSAWIAFVAAHFNTEEANMASRIALEGGAEWKDYIYSMLTAMHDGKCELLTLSEAYDAYGELDSGEL